jgi:hypothetical protein
VDNDEARKPPLAILPTVSTNFMKTMQRHITSIILTLFLCGQIFAQDTATTDFYAQIKNYDLSTIWTADSFLAEDNENENEKIKRAEILGFIGDDYQRLFIHFVSIIQNQTNPYEYFVYGKTKAKETICSFQGAITIRLSRTYIIGDIPNYKQGFVSCDVILYEDKKQSSTGFIKGTLKSNFIIDTKGQFRYDALSFMADGFSNNQFIGSWTSYKTKRFKKNAIGATIEFLKVGDLDIGAGEFSVNEKYAANGWISYILENMAPNGSNSKTKH